MSTKQKIIIFVVACWVLGALVLFFEWDSIRAASIASDAEAAADAGEWEQAIELYREAIEIETDYDTDAEYQLALCDVHLRHGRALVDAGDRPAAVDALSPIQRLECEDASKARYQIVEEILLADADACVDAKDWACAFGKLEKVEEMVPSDEEAHAQKVLDTKVAKGVWLAVEEGRIEAAVTHFELEGLMIEGAQALEDAEETKAAAALYETWGDIDKAVTLYAELGEHLTVARLEEERGDIEAAAKRYGAHGRPETAAELYETLEMWTDARTAYEDAELRSDAARMILEDEGRDAALEYADTHEIHDMRGHLLFDMGRLDAALAAFEAGEHWTEAAQLLEDHLERPLDAAAYQELAGNDRWAADLYEANGEPAKAAVIRERLGHEATAARLFAAGGEHAESARLWMATGLRRQAIAELRLAGDLQAAVDAWAELLATEPGYDARRTAAALAAEAGDEPRRARWLREAIDIAFDADAVRPMLDAAAALGTTPAAVDRVLVRVETLISEEEPYAAVDLLRAMNDWFADNPTAAAKVPGDRRDVARSQLDTVQKTLGAYPELDALTGKHNWREDSWVAARAFSNSTFKGQIANTTGVAIGSVTVEIKLFAKDLDAWVVPAENLEGPRWENTGPLMAEFTSAPATWTERVVIRNLLPGERRPFDVRARNAVPYQRFESTLVELVR